MIFGTAVTLFSFMLVIIVTSIVCRRKSRSAHAPGIPTTRHISSLVPFCGWRNRERQKREKQEKKTLTYNRKLDKGLPRGDRSFSTLNTELSGT